MGLGDLIDDAGSALQHANGWVEHTAGSLVDDGAHAVGTGLDAVGLHGAATSVDNAGDTAAGHFGVQVAEKDLGQTNDPTELVHGDVAAITQAGDKLTNFATAFGETASGLRGIDTTGWQGPAADAFRAVYQKHPQGWSDAQHACSSAAAALHEFGQAVQRAQGQAQQAIGLYQAAQTATQDAQAKQGVAVLQYNQQRQNYQYAQNLGIPVGPPPTQPEAFADPGAAGREQAQQLLDAARSQRNASGNTAQRAIDAALANAPQTPSFSTQLAADFSDGVTTAAVEGEHVLGGAAKGVGDVGKFARSLIPLDPYNATHPAEYAAGLSSTAAGVVHTALHPGDVVKGLVGTGWGSDPGEALGRLLPNIVGTVATDGATGEAAGAENAGRTVTENATTLDSGLADVDNDLARIHVRDPGSGQPVPPSSAEPTTPFRQPADVDPSSATATTPSGTAMRRATGDSGLANADRAAASRISGAGDGLATVENDLSRIHLHPVARPPARAPASSIASRSPDPDLDSGPASVAGETAPPTEPVPRSGATSVPVDVDHVRSSIAQTAVDPNIDLTDLDPSLKWRTSNEVLYRMESRSPLNSDILDSGLRPANNDGSLNLRSHVGGNTGASPYVSTTNNPLIYNDTSRQWMYVIHSPGGVDVNASLGAHDYAAEQEISMLGGVRPEYIEGAWRIQRGLDNVRHKVEWFPNPKFNPGG